MRIPKQPPASDELITRLIAKPEAVWRVIDAGLHRPTIGDRYVHWDKLRFLNRPAGISLEEHWAAIKLARRSLFKHLPLEDRHKRAFQIGFPDVLQRQLSEIDRDLSGRVKMPEALTNADTRDRYMISALIEEAITSSQLEGASTTAVVAREMLRSNRKPRDKSERMILNNFQAMQFVRESHASRLTPSLVLDIHKRVTADTLDDPADAGKLREHDNIHVIDMEGNVLHVPPNATELESRLRALCEFAAENTPDFYIHPVVRAALLHFWLAYDHPFVDGNGRTARAIFYRSMLNAGYSMCEFVSISHILRKAPAKYARAYLHTESDENDTTYFVLYQMDVLQRGITALHEYVRKKHQSIQTTRAVLRQSQSFNHRQLALLGHAMSHPFATYSVTSHATSHQITRQTARVDLSGLVSHGFLMMSKSGKTFIYTVPDDVERRAKSFGLRGRDG